MLRKLPGVTAREVFEYGPHAGFRLRYRHSGLERASACTARTPSGGLTWALTLVEDQRQINIGAAP